MHLHASSLLCLSMVSLYSSFTHDVFLQPLKQWQIRIACNRNMFPSTVTLPFWIPWWSSLGFPQHELPMAHLPFGLQVQCHSLWSLHCASMCCCNFSPFGNPRCCTSSLFGEPWISASLKGPIQGTLLQYQVLRSLGNWWGSCTEQM